MALYEVSETSLLLAAKRNLSTFDSISCGPDEHADAPRHRPGGYDYIHFLIHFLFYIRHHFVGYSGTGAGFHSTDNAGLFRIN